MRRFIFLFSCAYFYAYVDSITSQRKKHRTTKWARSSSAVVLSLIREFKITTTATATGTSLNKRFNEQNNGCARALFNKLTSVFYASVLLLIMNFVITLSK